MQLLVFDELTEAVKYRCVTKQILIFLPHMGNIRTLCRIKTECRERGGGGG